MKVRQWIIAGVLTLLVGAAIAGLLLTREQSPQAETEEPGQTTTAKKTFGTGSSDQQHPLVDQRPLQTARHMAQLASSREEQRLAREAEKVGDHEVDLAFADALRNAANNPPKLTPEMKVMLDRKTKAEAAVKADQESIDQLNKRLSSAPEAQKDNLEDQIAVAKGQIELDQDEFEDATEDLAQAGGDPQAKIKQLLEEHEAGHDAQNSSPTAPDPDYGAHTLYNAFRAWRELRARITQLDAAHEEASQKQQRLITRHGTFAKRVEQEKPNRENAKQQAAGFSQASKSSSREESKASARVALDSLKHYTEDQRNLADLGKRIQDEQELGDIYSNWITLVATRERTALHNMIEAVLGILVVVLLVYLAGRMTDRIFSGFAPENTRAGTMRAVVKFAMQALGALIILFIVLGMPSQTTTVLGLAGAGLTVAMKDFIVAFFGWFVLMGRNGLRVGDWVEINGVGGEVVEVGLLKTVVLETGNWTDAGHPTGRKVSFVNSFAIEGHFFNFTTSGQWMWDELQFSVPGDQDPYVFIDSLKKLVVKETEVNAKKADIEWNTLTSRYRVKGFSAEPAISVQPTGSGVEVRIRYITRASERHEMRKRLYEAVVDLIHGKRAAAGN
ncbi:MAG TPA: mechanosensitive ion channel domain-containing protein [Candidatus Sulfotelmatobacter sp.]